MTIHRFAKILNLNFFQLNETIDFSHQQGKVQDDPDDTQRRDQQVVAVSSALPITRRRHGDQLHGHLGNHGSTSDTLLHAGEGGGPC